MGNGTATDISLGKEFKNQNNASLETIPFNKALTISCFMLLNHLSRSDILPTYPRYNNQKKTDMSVYFRIIIKVNSTSALIMKRKAYSIKNGMVA